MPKRRIGGKTESCFYKLKKPNTRTGLLSGRSRQGVKRSNFKALSDRGRKRANWVTSPYKDLLEAFKEMKAASIKISPALLQCTAKALIADASPESANHRTMSDLTMSESQFLEDKITIRWNSDVHDES